LDRRLPPLVALKAFEAAMTQRLWGQMRNSPHMPPLQMIV
jgi:hypothetical protein